MPQAIVDPDELRRFAQQLRQFSQQVEQQMSRLHSRARELGNTWRDQEYQKYLETFEETLRALRLFVQATEEQVPFLLRKAQRAEEYLQQR